MLTKFAKKMIQNITGAEIIFLIMTKVCQQNMLFCKKKLTNGINNMDISYIFIFFDEKQTRSNLKWKNIICFYDD